MWSTVQQKNVWCVSIKSELFLKTNHLKEQLAAEVDSLFNFTLGPAFLTRVEILKYES